MRVSFLDFFDTRKLDSASPLVAFARVAVARVEKVPRRNWPEPVS